MEVYYKKINNSIEQIKKSEKPNTSNLKYTKTVKTIVFKPKTTIKSTHLGNKHINEIKRKKSIFISCSKKIIKSNFGSL